MTGIDNVTYWVTDGEINSNVVHALALFCYTTSALRNSCRRKPQRLTIAAGLENSIRDKKNIEKEQIIFRRALRNSKFLKRVTKHCEKFSKWLNECHVKMS